MRPDYFDKKLRLIRADFDPQLTTAIIGQFRLGETKYSKGLGGAGKGETTVRDWVGKELGQWWWPWSEKVGRLG